MTFRTPCLALSLALALSAPLAPAPAVAGDSHASEAKPAVSGWQAFGELVAGNRRFYEEKSIHPRQESARREELSKGQKPHSIILSCSDSRTAPEIVFDQGLGDLFPIRVAGNVPTAEAIASIEYAVVHLGSPLLVVMGHESCGAVKAALETPKGKTAGSPDLDTLLSEIRPHLDGENRVPASADPTLRQPVKAHVHEVAKELLARSQILREAVASGKLVLAQGIYSLKTGKVEFWDLGVTEFPSPAAAGPARSTASEAPAAVAAPAAAPAKAHPTGAKKKSKKEKHTSWDSKSNEGETE